MSIYVLIVYHFFALCDEGVDDMGVPQSSGHLRGRYRLLCQREPGTNRLQGAESWRPARTGTGQKTAAV